MAAEIDGDTVMMNIETGHYFGLDDIGSAAWKAIEKPSPIASIQTSLLEQYDVSSEQCTRDLLTFLSELLEQRIIHLV